MPLIVSASSAISPFTSSVSLRFRSPFATDVTTRAMPRTWFVRLSAIRFTLSVRSFQVPPTPSTRAWPPSLPCVPTSRATRVTSDANPFSWSTIVLMVFLSARISPRASTVIFFDRSPRATAVVTSAMLRTCSVRLVARPFTFSVRSRQVPSTPSTRASPPSLPCVPTSWATRVTSEAKRFSWSTIVLMVSFSSCISPWTVTVIFLDRSPRATAVVTSAMLRTWPVRFDAIEFTLSVRSFQVPATPSTRACPPSLPSVPTSRDTRDTSEAKADSWSTMVLMVFFSSAISPLASTVIFLDRSPRATAVVTDAISRTWLVRLVASPFTFCVSFRHVPATPSTSAWPPRMPSVPTSRATRVTSDANEDSWSTIVLMTCLICRISPSASTVICWVRSPDAIAVATFDTSRSWIVRFPAMPFTLSVRSRQVPATPSTRACPPSLPSVPTSRATRVTSDAKALSWSTMVFTVAFRSRSSPCTSTVILRLRSPRATAVVTSAMLRSCPVRFDAIELTLSVRSFQVPCAPATWAWPPSLPSVPTSRASRVTSSETEERCSTIAFTASALARRSPPSSRPLTSVATDWDRSPRETAWITWITPLKWVTRQSMMSLTPPSATAQSPSAPFTRARSVTLLPSTTDCRSRSSSSVTAAAMATASLNAIAMTPSLPSMSSGMLTEKSPRRMARSAVSSLTSRGDRSSGIRVLSGMVRSLGEGVRVGGADGAAQGARTAASSAATCCRASIRRSGMHGFSSTAAGLTACTAGSRSIPGSPDINRTAVPCVASARATSSPLPPFRFMSRSARSGGSASALAMASCTVRATPATRSPASSTTSARNMETSTSSSAMRTDRGAGEVMGGFRSTRHSVTSALPLRAPSRPVPDRRKCDRIDAVRGGRTRAFSGTGPATPATS